MSKEVSGKKEVVPLLENMPWILYLVFLAGELVESFYLTGRDYLYISAIIVFVIIMFWLAYYLVDRIKESGGEK